MVLPILFFLYVLIVPIHDSVISARGILLASVLALLESRATSLGLLLGSRYAAHITYSQTKYVLFPRALQSCNQSCNVRWLITPTKLQPEFVSYKSFFSDRFTRLKYVLNQSRILVGDLT